MAYSAVLDANVLHPVILCDTLLRFAEKGFFRPLWSAEILEETVASIARRRSMTAHGRSVRRVEHMQAAFPDALVTGHATLAGTLANEFGNDAHVVAAAVTGSADVIVTHNVRDFPVHRVQPHGVLVQTPDAFLVQQWWRDAEIAARVLVEQSAGTRRPHLPPLELLDKLGRLVPDFAALARGSTELTSSTLVTAEHRPSPGHESAPCGAMAAQPRSVSRAPHGSRRNLVGLWPS